MTTCIYCKEEFEPNSNNQKTCFRQECKKQLNRKKMREYRKRKREEREKFTIYLIVKEKGPISADDIRQMAQNDYKLRINNVDISKHIKIFSKNCKINEIFKSYYINENLPSYPYIFYIDNYQIKIPPSHLSLDYFPEFLTVEGLTVDKSHIIRYYDMDLKTAIQKCARAYAALWANLLSFWLYDQLYMEKGPHNELISFFLHGFDRLCGPHILAPRRFWDSKISNEDDQRGDIPWYGSTFCHALTAAYIDTQIRNSGKGVISLFKRGDIREKKDDSVKILHLKDITDTLSRIYEHLKPQINVGYSNFRKKAGKMDKEEQDFYSVEYAILKELLNELKSYINNRLVCERINDAIKKTILFHGEPFLPIEQIQ